ncbi:uncharacterized protein EI90DRAFT_784074 [Cantharellus anzutake]|uniref:uncharacterized protein n=1 Tax=Cantharellus anzutake TaxID=1750568 RepID=UPI001908C1D1|nr:uncharacterized protein EI90DRAFT_784074 [Cantharellus anzutake]KAF8342765.1 hypothetical protein EI90DRAFT_784074 [Cantharellus anzutake]
MPTKIHVFRDDDITSTISSSRAPSSSRASSRAPSMTPGPTSSSSRRPSISSRRLSLSNGGGISQVQVVGKSLISTNVSTVTMALNKENRDPVTGVLLSELLNSLGCSGKTGKQTSGGGGGTSLEPASVTTTPLTKQKFLATTITTTVLSPVLDSSPPSSTRATPEPHSATRKGEDDDEGSTNDALATPRPPQRKSRVVVSSIDSPASRTRAKTGSSSSELVIRKGRVPLAQKSTISGRGLKGSPLKSKSSMPLYSDDAATTMAASKRTRSSRSAKKTALKTDVDPSDLLSLPLPSSEKSSSSKSGTKSNKKSSSSASNKRVKNTVMSQHASFVRSTIPSFAVFQDNIPAPASASAFLPSSAPHLEMDYLLQGSSPSTDNEDVEMHDANEVSAIVQRLVDQKCRELTVRPLANVSEAYGASSSAFGSSVDGEGIF